MPTAKGCTKSGLAKSSVGRSFRLVRLSSIFLLLPARRNSVVRGGVVSKVGIFGGYELQGRVIPIGCTWFGISKTSSTIVRNLLLTIATSNWVSRIVFLLYDCLAMNGCFRCGTHMRGLTALSPASRKRSPTHLVTIVMRCGLPVETSRRQLVLRTQGCFIVERW